MWNKIVYITLFAFGIFFQSSTAQDVIKLQNPSFEDVPRRGSSPAIPIKGWFDCGATNFPTETPPDIHPSSAWEVSKEPYDGYTYLGMVTRDNDSWESVSQALSLPLQGGKCYSFTAFISKSERYRSATKRSDSLQNFDKPAVLQIWGGDYFCEKKELLGESPPVSNLNWKQYKFVLQPKRTYNYITFEAFYKTPILEAYNGHILLDALSDIVQIKCPLMPEDLIAEVSDPPSKISPAINSGHTSSSSSSSSGKTSSGGNSGKTSSGTVSSGPKTFKPMLLTELVPDKIYVGQKIRLNHLYFKADSVNLLPNSYKVLDELVEYLKAYPKTIIEIGGHTNTIPPDDYCNHLSTQRAKSVQEYLISQGIPANRLKYKGYGKTDPLIAYDKYNKEARLKNQRVEIKILALS